MSAKNALQNEQSAAYFLIGTYFASIMIQPIIVYNMSSFAAAGVTVGVIANIAWGALLYVSSRNIPRKFLSSAPFYIIVAYMIWSAVGLIAHPRDRTPTALLTWLSDAVLFFGMFRAMTSGTHSYKKLIVYTAIGSSIGLVILAAYILAVSPPSSGIFIFYAQKVFFRNALANYAVISMIICGAGIASASTSRSQIICSAGAIASLLVAALAASKTVWLALPIVCLCMAAVLVSRAKNKFIAILSVAGGITALVIAGIATNFDLAVRNLLIQYYYGGAISARERQFIWDYTNSFFEHWWDYILGMGYNAAVTIELGRGERIYSLHNDWLNLLFMAGYGLGPLLYILNICLIAVSGYEILKGSKAKPIAYFFPLFIYIFVRGFSEANIGFTGVTWSVFVVICFMETTFRQDGKSHKPNLASKRLRPISSDAGKS